MDDHNRLWYAGSYGMACGGINQPVCPAGVTSPASNYGVAFVYDATTGAQLAQYTLTAATSKTMNDMTISGNAVYFSNTTAPSGAGSEVQFKLQLGPGGALPPGDVPATAPRSPANPAVTNIPTPGFTGADGIDTLPNGNIIINSVNGASNGQMIVIDTTTLAVTPVTVAAAPRASRASARRRSSRRRRRPGREHPLLPGEPHRRCDASGRHRGGEADAARLHDGADRRAAQQPGRAAALSGTRRTPSSSGTSST